MGAFLSAMEEELEKAEIQSMTDLHAEAQVIVCKLKKRDAELELLQYQKVISYATPDMSAFDALIERMEELVGEIKDYEREIKNVIEWRR